QGDEPAQGQKSRQVIGIAEGGAEVVRASEGVEAEEGLPLGEGEVEEPEQDHGGRGGDDVEAHTAARARGGGGAVLEHDRRCRHAERLDERRPGGGKVQAEWAWARGGAERDLVDPGGLRREEPDQAEGEGDEAQGGGEGGAEPRR